MRHPDGRSYSARGNQGAGLHGSSLSIRKGKRQEREGRARGEGAVRAMEVGIC